jgi:hypothetical protein
MDPAESSIENLAVSSLGLISVVTSELSSMTIDYLRISDGETNLFDSM